MTTPYQASPPGRARAGSLESPQPKRVHWKRFERLDSPTTELQRRLEESFFDDWENSPLPLRAYRELVTSPTWDVIFKDKRALGFSPTAYDVASYSNFRKTFRGALSEYALGSRHVAREMQRRYRGRAGEELKKFLSAFYHAENHVHRVLERTNSAKKLAWEERALTKAERARLREPTGEAGRYLASKYAEIAPILIRAIWDDVSDDVRSPDSLAKYGLDSSNADVIDVLTSHASQTQLLNSQRPERREVEHVVNRAGPETYVVKHRGWPLAHAGIASVGDIPASKLSRFRDYEAAKKNLQKILAGHVVDPWHDSPAG